MIDQVVHDRLDVSGRNASPPGACPGEVGCGASADVALATSRRHEKRRSEKAVKTAEPPRSSHAQKTTAQGR